MEKFMRFPKSLTLGLAALIILASAGCLPRLKPALPPDVSLQPGRYLKECYRAPGFQADGLAYALLTPFALETAQGIAPDAFLSMFSEELSRAFQANGLKLSEAKDACQVSGTVQLVKVRTSFRFLLGRISADLIVSGAIMQGDQVLFAFQDRLTLASPVKPGAPAPKEAELLLRQLSSTFAAHLLTELLFYGFPEAAG